MKKLSIAALIAVGSSLAMLSSAQLIHQNDGTTGTAEQNPINASQNFESTFSSDDVISVDDMTTTTSNYLNSFQFGLDMFNNGAATEAGITGFHVEIYTYNGGTPPNSLVGNVASFDFTGLTNGQSANVSASAAGYAGFSQGYLMTLNLGGTFQLAAGSYWIGVIMDNSFTANGEAGIMSSSLNTSPSNGPNAWQMNPGGGFGLAGNEAEIVNGTTGGHVNLSESLFGTATPEPASMAVLGLGLVGLVARRRRSSK